MQRSWWGFALQYGDWEQELRTRIKQGQPHIFFKSIILKAKIHIYLHHSIYIPSIPVDVKSSTSSCIVVALSVALKFRAMHGWWQKKVASLPDPCWNDRKVSHLSEHEIKLVRKTKAKAYPCINQHLGIWKNPFKKNVNTSSKLHLWSYTFQFSGHVGLLSG